MISGCANALHAVVIDPWMGRADAARAHRVDRGSGSGTDTSRVEPREIATFLIRQQHTESPVLQ